MTERTVSTAYQGWNKEEMLAAGSAPSNPNNRTSASFTPINHNRTPLPPSRPLHPVRKGLESDYLYELRDEPGPAVPTVPAKTAKKRKSPIARGRVVSLGQVLEYEDEGDIHNNGLAFKEPPPKRKKTPISKRSQSMKIPSTSNAKWEDDEENTSKHEKQALQLTIAPGSSKRKPSKVGPGGSMGKAKQMPAFKNPTITKPSVGGGKESAPPRSNSIITHHGWRSTEESVKSTSVVLAKTTMEKLASFRFKPPPEPHTAHVSPPTPQNVSSNVVAGDLPHESSQDIVHASSDYGLPSDGSFFHEALWAVESHSHFDNHLPIEEQDADQKAPINAIDKKGLPQDQPTNGSRLFEFVRDTSLRAVPVTGIVSTGNNPQSSKDVPEPCEDGSTPYDLTSSEARVLQHLTTTEPSLGQFSQTVDTCTEDPVAAQCQMRDFEMLEGNARSIASDFQPSADQLLPTCELDRALTVDSLGPVDSLRNQSFAIPHGESRHVLSAHYDPASSSENDVHDNLQTKRQLPATYQALRGCLTKVQVERSDIDEPETMSKVVSEDLWGSDEFDQGLDDDDLLAIAANAAIPQSPEKPQPPQQKSSKTCGRFLLRSTTAGPSSQARDSLTSQRPAIENVIELNSSSPQHVPGLDEEFPMDDGDEEEMLKLSELTGGIKESFVPPESVQQAFNDTADGEVYDSSLQFSPPKSQARGASPSKVTRDQHTDKSRTSQSPGFGKESLPLGEEEDWSFIRSDDLGEAETMSDPFCDPQTGPRRRADPGEAISSSPARRSVPDRASFPPTTQQTANKAWPLIDDSHEYEAMNPFARPDFPVLVLDRSPVVGLSPQTYLRTCFRIGEMLREGMRCASLGQDAVIELFGRVRYSSRESGSTKQHFQFADLWHDRPPYPNGLLANYKTTGRAESESMVFVSENGKMARCLGRLTRDMKNNTWVLHIINIRETDWEEMRWTKEVVSHGQVKAEVGWVSKL